MDRDVQFSATHYSATSRANVVEPFNVQQSHPFETRGLGRAPFRCVELTEAKVVAPSGKLVSGSGGRCQFCGKALRYEFWVQSADGNRFSVGRDCVGRVDYTLARSADDIQRAFNARTAAELRVQFRKMLDASPNIWVDQLHPKLPGKTMRDYIEFVLVYGGDPKIIQLSKRAAPHPKNGL
jgi:hypothetical protein